MKKSMAFLFLLLFGLYGCSNVRTFDPIIQDTDTIDETVERSIISSDFEIMDTTLDGYNIILNYKALYQMKDVIITVSFKNSNNDILISLTKDVGDLQKGQNFSLYFEFSATLRAEIKYNQITTVQGKTIQN